MPTSLIPTIKKIAHDVYRTLGSGFEEATYENAMSVGLRLAKIPYVAQKAIEITYKAHFVGEGYSDLIVGRGSQRLVLELKATGKLGDKEDQQLRNYLRILKIKRGLLINFQAPGANTKGKTKLEVREVSN